MSTLTRPSAAPEPETVKSHREHPNKKRSRGRPTGSSRFTETDQTSLEKIADALVREPGLQPTVVIRRLGYYGEAEIRRLQSKWRKERHRLLAEAQRLLDAEPPTTFLDSILDMCGTLGSFVHGLTTSPAMRSLRASLDRQARRRTARDELGIAPRSPIEPGNQEDLERAIERFEERPHQSVSDLIADLPAEMTVDEMPPSLRLYAMALILHEMALNVKQRETAALGRASEEGRGVDQNGGGNERGPKQ